MVIGLVLVGISATFFVSWALSKTIIKGKPSLFTLELPPYRKPQVVQVIARSFLDRTVFVLGRAVIVRLAGAIIWIMANVFIGDISFIRHATGWLVLSTGFRWGYCAGFLLGLPPTKSSFPSCSCVIFLPGPCWNWIASVPRDLLIFQAGPLTALNVMLFRCCIFLAELRFLRRQRNRSFKWPAVGGNYHCYCCRRLFFDRPGSPPFGPCLK